MQPLLKEYKLSKNNKLESMLYNNFSKLLSIYTEQNDLKNPFYTSNLIFLNLRINIQNGFKFG